jgi:hypothetical protein
MMPSLETLRLWLRPLELADAKQEQILFPHWRSYDFLRRLREVADCTVILLRLPEP